MVILKEYEAYLKVKRFIDGHDESEIISRLMGDNKYVPLTIISHTSTQYIDFVDFLHFSGSVSSVRAVDLAP